MININYKYLKMVQNFLKTLNDVFASITFRKAEGNNRR